MESENPRYLDLSNAIIGNDPFFSEPPRPVLMQNTQEEQFLNVSGAPTLVTLQNCAPPANNTNNDVVKALTSSIAYLTHHNNKLSDENEKLKEENAGLQAKVNELETENQALRQDGSIMDRSCDKQRVILRKAIESKYAALLKENPTNVLDISRGATVASPQNKWLRDEIFKSLTDEPDLVFTASLFKAQFRRFLALQKRKSAFKEIPETKQKHNHGCLLSSRKTKKLRRRKKALQLMMQNRDSTLESKSIKSALAMMTPAYMSSEDEVEDETTGLKHWKVKKIPMEPSIMTRIKRAIDTYHTSHLNSGAFERMKPAVKDETCPVSNRKKMPFAPDLSKSTPKTSTVRCFNID